MRQASESAVDFQRPANVRAERFERGDQRLTHWRAVSAAGVSVTREFVRAKMLGEIAHY
jgi:hypothetical protein